MCSSNEFQGLVDCNLAADQGMDFRGFAHFVSTVAAQELDKLGIALTSAHMETPHRHQQQHCGEAVAAQEPVAAQEAGKLGASPSPPRRSMPAGQPWPQ